MFETREEMYTMVANVHKVIFVAMLDPEISQRMIDFLYDNMKNYLEKEQTPLTEFTFLDGQISIILTAKFNNYINKEQETYLVELHHKLHTLLDQFFLNALQDPHIGIILKKYDTNGILETLAQNSIKYQIIMSQCVSVLNLSVLPYYYAFKINFHN